MHYTIGVDPGLRCTGISIFLGSVLVFAAAVENPNTGRGPAAWRALADLVAKQAILDPAIPVKEVVVEKMVSYPGSPVKVDDLMELVGVTGAVVSAIPLAVRYTSYEPREWKGQVPKKIHNSRTLAKLTQAEKSLLVDIDPVLVNNAIDAVGLVLFRIGR